jgi:hypothetical protein
MKKILLSFIGSLLFFQIFCQDVIFKKDGTEIQAIALEIDLDAVKYKNFDLSNGTIRNLPISEIFMIKYENGDKYFFDNQPELKYQTIKKDSVNSSFAAHQPLKLKGHKVKVNGTKLSKSEVRKLMAPYPEALDSYNSGRSLHGMGITCFWTGIGAYIVVFSMTNNTVDALIALSPFIVGDVIFTTLSGRKLRFSVDLYNNNINKPTTYKLNFGIQNDGIGFALKF